MPVILRTPGRWPFRLQGNTEDIAIAIGPEFWDTTVIDDRGTTTLDLNLAALVQELRTAVYYISTQDLTQH